MTRIFSVHQVHAKAADNKEKVHSYPAEGEELIDIHSCDGQRQIAEEHPAMCPDNS
jgi:hypothetical protein